MNNFEDIVKLHIKTITDRNLTAFSDFLHPSQNSMLILPNGNMIEGYENVLNFHKEWFMDKDWHMDTQIVDILTVDSCGYALLDVTYRDLDEDGNPYELNYFLSLLFKRMDSSWILLRDQNTLK
jgi:hypothetical protein